MRLGTFRIEWLMVVNHSLKINNFSVTGFPLNSSLPAVLLCVFEWYADVSLRNVSFRYPGSETFALRNTSFKIKQGQLCVRPLGCPPLANRNDNGAHFCVIKGDCRCKRLRQEYNSQIDISSLRSCGGRDTD